MEHAIRAVLTKELLGVVRTWDAGPAEAVLGEVGDPGITQIDALTPIGWMDFGLHMRLSDAIRAEVGPEGNVQTWIDAFERVSHRPILASFFAAMFRISGSPATVFKRTATVYQLLNRNIGSLAFAFGDGPNDARIDLVEFPAAEYSIDCYAEGLLGCIRAVMHRSDENGEAVIDVVDPSTGHAGYALNW